jgi:hypothetical protein
VPHVRAVLAARGRLPGTGEADLAGCAAAAGQALIRAGQYAAALDLARAGAERDSGLDADHLAVIALRERHADARLFLGQAAGAEAEFRQVLDARLRILGPGHPDTVDAWTTSPARCGTRVVTQTPRPGSGTFSTPDCGSWDPSTPHPTLRPDRVPTAPW